MATNAQIAAELLREAASFFRQVGEQNQPVRDQMDQNAQLYERMAERVAAAPTESFDAAGLIPED